MAPQSNDGSFASNGFKHGKHRRPDGDAGQHRAGAIHYHAELCAFFFGEGFNDGFDLGFGETVHRLKPVGEFNQIRLVIKGNHIEHWLNGEKVVEFERGSEALKALIAQSKFKDQPKFGTFAKGHILLQEHGDKVWYRNIKIREIK